MCYFCSKATENSALLIGPFNKGKAKTFKICAYHYKLILDYLEGLKNGIY